MKYKLYSAVDSFDDIDSIFLLSEDGSVAVMVRSGDDKFHLDKAKSLYNSYLKSILANRFSYAINPVLIGEFDV